MESFLAKRDQKKQQKLYTQSQQSPLAQQLGQSSNQPFGQPQSDKKNFESVKEIDSQSIQSSQPSFVKDQPKEKIPLADTRKGKILDTVAAFVGLPHICSNE